MKQKLITNRTLIVSHALRAITLVIGDFGVFDSVWTVDWNLHVIATKTMTMSIGIREKAALEARNSNSE